MLLQERKQTVGSRFLKRLQFVLELVHNVGRLPWDDALLQEEGLRPIKAVKHLFFCLLYIILSVRDLFGLRQFLFFLLLLLLCCPYRQEPSGLQSPRPA